MFEDAHQIIMDRYSVSESKQRFLKDVYGTVGIPAQSVAPFFIIEDLVLSTDIVTVSICISVLSYLKSAIDYSYTFMTSIGVAIRSV